MSSTPHYAHCDTKKPDGFYVQFEQLVMDDDHNPRPDTVDDGFWPSKDPEAAGYVPPDMFDAEQLKAERRMRAWDEGDWNFIGVRARAKCLIVSKGTGTYINLDSPGVWGIESDCDESYKSEIFNQEIATLKDMIAAMHDPVYET